MSSPLSSEHLAVLHDDARRLAGRAGAHEERLQDLVRASETSVRYAQIELAQAVEAIETTAAELDRVFTAHLKRLAETADAAREACATGREQRVGACRLLSRLGDECGADEELPPRAGGPAVLVVDDVADVRDLVADVLRDAGYTVRTASDGLEALIAAHEMQPEVIVMDMTMPVLDGIEATRLIKARKATRHASVIAYTGSPTVADRLGERLFVAVGQKPAEPDGVLAAVRSAANR
jgi:CheY-like chemotaxis protein